MINQFHKAKAGGGGGIMIWAGIVGDQLAGKYVLINYKCSVLMLQRKKGSCWGKN